MPMKKLICFALTICIVLCTLCGCEVKKNKYTATSMDFFDTPITITGYENTKEEFDDVANDILTQFEKYHKLFSIYDEFEGVNNIYTINKIVDGEHQTVTVDKSIIDMLLYSKEMFDKTNGVMNIAMGSVLSIWHEYREKGNENPKNATLPPVDALKEAAKHTDITKMVIEKENNTVTLLDPKMTLDVGAVAKGYATQCIVNYLKEKGVTSYLLNVGGSVTPIGTKETGEDWSVAIENPEDGEYLACLSLKDKSVVTSGNYQRYYTVDGKKYHHIIDKNTLMPSDKFLSVSVICEDTALGDTLSTALFCMTLEEGKKLINIIPNTEALWFTPDSETYTTNGWNKYEK